jgi:hypothetical protein
MSDYKVKRYFGRLNVDKTLHNILTQIFEKADSFTDGEFIELVMKAWRDGDLTLAPDHMRRADVVNKALKAWRDDGSPEWEPSEAQCAFEQAADETVKPFIEREVARFLKECEPTPEELKRHWVAREKYGWPVG